MMGSHINHSFLCQLIFVCCLIIEAIVLPSTNFWMSEGDSIDLVGLSPVGRVNRGRLAAGIGISFVVV